MKDRVRICCTLACNKIYRTVLCMAENLGLHRSSHFNGSVCIYGKDVVHLNSFDPLQISSLTIKYDFVCHMPDHAVRPHKLLSNSSHQKHYLLIIPIIWQFARLQKLILNPRPNHIIFNISNNLNLPISFHLLIIKIKLLRNILHTNTWNLVRITSLISNLSYIGLEE
jgi:hypothetical protein